MNNINIEIGLRLRIARKTAEYKTALNFASKMKIPKSTYSQHENGKRSLTAEQITFYADKLNVDARWLLTGLGHPCPLEKNRIERKENIERQIAILQEAKELPYLKNSQINMDDNAAVVNMELFSKVLVSAISTLAAKSLNIQAEEVVSFCIHVYNNIEFLMADDVEKNKIIDLSINSMLKGYDILLKKTINA